ncbi:MAG: SMI1/KNR4 family protein [Chitinophagaceae bacterium]|nr:SMI1/KNR4 family protein [Chitinophagaceae bacterium]
MKQAWQKIETWIKVNHPAMLETLNVGATSQNFLELETLLEDNLPEDFKEFYSIHNGQSWTHLNLFDGDRLLSIEDIIRVWQGWKTALPEIDANCRETFGQPARSSPDTRIKVDWWNLAWIPITANGSGDSYCIDLDPDSKGTSGQIIRMWHDDPSRELIATSFRDWIYTYINDLGKGVYETSDDIGWGGIVRKD